MSVWRGQCRVGVQRLFSFFLALARQKSGHRDNCEKPAVVGKNASVQISPRIFIHASEISANRQKSFCPSREKGAKRSSEQPETQTSTRQTHTHGARDSHRRAGEREGERREEKKGVLSAGEMSDVKKRDVGCERRVDVMC